MAKNKKLNDYMLIKKPLINMSGFPIKTKTKLKLSIIYIF